MRAPVWCWPFVVSTNYMSFFFGLERCVSSDISSRSFIFVTFIRALVPCRSFFLVHFVRDFVFSTHVSSLPFGRGWLDSNGSLELWLSPCVHLDPPSSSLSVFCPAIRAGGGFLRSAFLQQRHSTLNPNSDSESAAVETIIIRIKFRFFRVPFPPFINVVFHCPVDLRICCRSRILSGRIILLEVPVVLHSPTTQQTVLPAPLPVNRLIHRDNKVLSSHDAVPSHIFEDRCLLHDTEDSRSKTSWQIEESVLNNSAVLVSIPLSVPQFCLNQLASICKKTMPNSLISEES